MFLKKLVSCLVGALAAPLCLAGAPLEWVFDGTLPAGVTLERSTARLDESGDTVGADVPVFADRAYIENGATLVAEADPVLTVLTVREVGGTVYTIVRDNTKIFLTTGTPGVSDPLVRIEPDAAMDAKFGMLAEWGVAASAEIHADGTILIHTSSSQDQSRAKTVRSSIATFDQPNGFALVRDSDYIPPVGSGTTSSPPWFTRTTHLPNLGIDASGVVEYKSSGLESTTYPGDGRAIGYASTDGGQTWQRVIDTDDPLLGRDLVVTAKHLHHIEPFEWFDDGAQEWKVGAVALLGDEPTSSGLIFIFADGDSFPDPDLGNYPTLERRKALGRDMLTDLYPLDSSMSAGDPMRFLLGQDTAQAGIVETTIDGPMQSDRYIWRPTTTFYQRASWLESLCTAPYIFQMGRLANGCFVAPTIENQPLVSPNGFMLSDPSGEHWVTARLINGNGYSGFSAVGADMFWTVDRGAVPQVSQLWQLPTPQVEQALLCSGGASSATSIGLLANNAIVSTSVATGAVSLPEELPAGTSVYRAQSTAHIGSTRIDDGTITPISASAGQLVSLVTWIKPAIADMNIADLDFHPVFHNGGGEDSTFISRLRPDMNGWTRVVVSREVPAGGATGVEFEMTPSPSTFVASPIDCYFTQPMVVVSDQAVVHAYAPGGATAADVVSLDLPAMGSEWTVQIDCTEELAFAMSLTDGSSRDITVQSASTEPTFWQGIRSVLELRANIDSTARFPLVSGPRDIFYPTRSRITVVMSQPGDTVKLYVKRGMGDIEGYAMAEIPFTPTGLQLATPDGSAVFQGALHRIRVWPNEALDLGPAAFVDPCPQDVNGDGSVDVNDISFVLFRLGDTGDPDLLEGDANNDGVVDVNDISAVLFNVGPCPVPE